MYEFIDIDGQQSVENVLPSAAMNFNGLFIENEIEGYRTLTVSGRESIGVELTSHSTQTGSLTTNKLLPSRTLVVKYLLKEQDNYSFQKKFKQLRKYLSSKSEVEIYFADEPDAFYFGQLSEMSEVPAETNFAVGTFSIHCDSPYKFGNLNQTNGSVTIDTFYETQPELVRLTLTSANSIVKVTNGKQAIQLNGNFSASDVIEIDVQEGTVIRNGVDHTYTVALNSDFENFMIEEGQTVSSQQGSLTLFTRERWL